MKKLLFIILLFIGFRASAQLPLATFHTTLNVANVVDYGAIDDGTTDCTTAFKAALNYLSHNGGGTLYIPCIGAWKITDSLVLAQGISVWCGNGIGEQADSTAGGKITRYPPGTILYNQAAKDCWIVNHAYCQAHGVCTVNTASGTPTSSHGWLINNAIGWRQDNCSTYYFYENEHIVNSSVAVQSVNWTIDHCFWVSSVKWNLIIEDKGQCDGGDAIISNSYSYQGFYSSASHFEYLSGGGLKILGCKFNQVGTNRPVHCVYAPITCATVDFIMTGCSVENHSGCGACLVPNGGTFAQVLINSNQFSPGQTLSTGFNIVQVGNDAATIANATVAGNVFVNQSAGSTTGSFPSDVYTNWNVIATGSNIKIGPNACSSVSLGAYDNYSLSSPTNNTIITSTGQHTIPSGTTTTFDLNYGVNQITTLTSNSALKLLSSSGSSFFNYGKLVVLQNGTGGFNLTAGTFVDFYGPIKTINPAPGSYTTLDIGNTFDGVGFITTVEDWRTNVNANLASQTSAGTIATQTSSAATATYNISGYVNVTAISTDVIQYQITYTDETNTAQTISGATISGTGNNTIPLTSIRCKASTTITVKTNLTLGGGTVAFDAGATIQQVN